MANAAQQGDKLNVFISYSRDDLAFADQLRAALLAYDFAVTIDREGATSGEDWKKRLGRLIRDADTIVFVLSPSSAHSSTCDWEAKEAVNLGKRILPLLCRPLGDVTPPPELAALQYTYFYDEPKFPGSGFGTGLNSLRLALNTDPDWLREHTRYLRLAKEWEEVGKPSDRRLLSAADIVLAKEWVATRPEKASPPTELQLEFIKASHDEDIRRQSAEAERLHKVAEAERQAKIAAESTAREAAARAAAETELRSIAEQQGREAAARAHEEAKLRAIAERASNETQRLAHTLRQALAVAIALGFVALSGFGVAFYEYTQTKEQLNRANQAVAESINSDLGLRPNEPLDPRQQQALWKLVLADEPVKGDFIAILAKSPKETVRVSPGFAQISRALGLLRPSGAEVESLLKPVLEAGAGNPRCLVRLSGPRAPAPAPA